MIANLNMQLNLKLKLPSNVLSIITSFLGKRRDLVYGQVQSGKTAHILNICRSSVLPTILVLQNSLLQLQQCCQRFLDAGHPFQVIDSTTEYLIASAHKTTIVINNKMRLDRLEALWFDTPGLSCYTVIIDEADASAERLCARPLIMRADREVHVTATPFLRFYHSYFHSVEVLTAPKGYVGLANVRRAVATYANTGLAGHAATIADFMLDGGMLLVVTRRVWQADIVDTARQLSLELHVPCISLATDRVLFEGGRLKKRFSTCALSTIIDQFQSEPRLVIVAHNLATRGLSFVSSDYTRRLTHQIILADAAVTPLLQRCRLFGLHPSAGILSIPTPNSLDKADKNVLFFDPAPFIC